MLTLYGFGPAFGLPDASPYVMKAEVQMKMGGLAYRKVEGDLARSPKGKLPYIDDAGQVVADSTFIRAYLERAYGFDLDEGLEPRARATAWATERMIEDHLGWALLHLRWLVPENFARGPAHFFDGLPEPARGQVRDEALEEIRQALRGHGLGRHSQAEITALAASSLGALSELLGDQPFLTGARPVGVDATAFAFVSGLLCPLFDSPVREAALRRENLTAYAERMMRLYFPEFADEPLPA